MKNVATSNTSSAKFRHSISKTLLGKDINMHKYNVSRLEIADLLESDIEAYFGKDQEDLESFLCKGRFTSYDGKFSGFMEQLDGRDRLEFLMLSYLGKMNNRLRVSHTNPDLSTLAFLNRINTFAKVMKSLTGKATKVTIAAENHAFDISIFSLGKSTSAKLETQTLKLLGEFKLSNIAIEPLETFLGGDDYYDEFERNLDAQRGDRKLLKSSGFRRLSSIFYYTYPTKDFKNAVRMYTSRAGKSEISQWAKEAALRYIAFHEARAKTGFWEKNGRYIRSSVSSRPGILVFQYGPGRVSPFQGVSTLKNGTISTENFSDLIYGCRLKKADFNVSCYDSMPFYFDMDIRKRQL